MTKRILILFSLTVFNTASAQFVVTTFSSNSVDSLAIADGLISGTINNNGTASQLSDFIDFYDGSGGAGNFVNDRPFPGGYLDNFTLHATCVLQINTPDTYTFGTNNDDGVRLKIDGNDIIVDDSLHAPTDFFGEATLSQGLHELDLVFFEFEFGATIELFAMQGTVGNSYELIGDTVNGGLSCSSNDIIFANGFD